MGVGDDDVRHRLAAHRVEQRIDVLLVEGTGIDDGDLAAPDDVAQRPLEGERARIVDQDAPHAGHDLLDHAGREIERAVEWDVVGHWVGTFMRCYLPEYQAWSIRHLPPLPGEYGFRKTEQMAAISLKHRPGRYLLACGTDPEGERREKHSFDCPRGRTFGCYVDISGLGGSEGHGPGEGPRSFEGHRRDKMSFTGSKALSGKVLRLGSGSGLRVPSLHVRLRLPSVST